jgi:hypothetical protein
MSTVIPLSFGRDIQGYNAYAPQPSTLLWRASLLSANPSVPSDCIVPSTFPLWIVSFRYFPNNVWVDVSGATATIPSNNTLQPTTAELNPASLQLTAGTTISMITNSSSASVSVVMWPYKMG